MHDVHPWVQLSPPNFCDTSSSIGSGGTVSPTLRSAQTSASTACSPAIAPYDELVYCAALDATHVGEDFTLRPYRGPPLTLPGPQSFAAQASTTLPKTDYVVTPPAIRPSGKARPSTRKYVAGLAKRALDVGRRQFPARCFGNFADLTETGNSQRSRNSVHLLIDEESDAGSFWLLGDKASDATDNDEKPCSEETQPRMLMAFSLRFAQAWRPWPTSELHAHIVALRVQKPVATTPKYTEGRIEENASSSQVFREPSSKSELFDPNAIGTWLLSCRNGSDETEVLKLLQTLQNAGCVRFDQHKQYRIFNALCAGGVGSVFLAQERRTGQKVAMKFIDRSNTLRGGVCGDPSNVSSNEVIEFDSQKEISMLRLVKDHPCFVQIRGLFCDATAVSIVMEYVDGGHLGDVIKTMSRVPPRMVRHIARQVFSALAWLCKYRIVHRDIKAENILQSGPDCQVIKVTDFSLAASEDDVSSTGRRCGSLGYIAPEVCANRRSCCSSDCFSAGVLIYYLLTGNPPFSGKDVASITRATILCQPNFAPIWDVDDRETTLEQLKESLRNAVALLSRLLVADETKRLVASDALTHPFVGDLASLNVEPVRPTLGETSR
eukprot:TRINITY_DN37427_c0_g1_i1.p1 TRINITY_DN37427_c0_g1~~TRINITY_DN37427_c0_g1_i1.p1  ORF type:complete len:607 (+),score=80.84 TRINITY_DN37427_c0_g1_i1:56-1876(+)